MTSKQTIARRRMRLAKRVLIHLAWAPASLTWVAAGAQEAAPAMSKDAETLDTVVVTSNKRVEKQRDVAGTVSVIDGLDLERRGARDQEDALKLTPGVQLNKGDPNNNTITIRGLGTISSTEGGGLQQQPTGFYLEDVPLASPIGKGLIVDVLPFDLDRIEVLRGPQGALFGSGSLGGAIRYLYAKPNLDSFQASAQAAVSNVSHGTTGFQTYGMLNVPLSTDVAALRIVGFDRTDPGYIDNLGTGKDDANEVRQRGGRMLLTVRPVREFTATVVASSQKTTQDDRFYVAPEPGTLTHNAPVNGGSTSQFDFGSLTMDYDLGAATITSITGYWNAKSKGQYDDTALFASVGLRAPVVLRPFDSKSHAASEELRIANKAGGPFSYVAGLFYQKSSGNSLSSQSTPGFQIFRGAPQTLVDLSTQLGGTEKAAFFDGEYALGAGWSAEVGGRYYRTTTRYRSDGTVFGAPSNSDAPNGEDSGTTPKAAIKYHFGDNLWYALASKGYRYGGVNASPPFASYKSDTLWNYETGVRLNPARNLQVDLTAFYMDWKNAQFTTFDTSGPIPFSGISNVGKARSTGLEAALQYRLAPAFDVGAALAYIDAKTRQDVLDSSRNLIRSGARLPGTAHLQTALQATYRFAAPFGSQGRFNVTDTYVGRRSMDLPGFYHAGGFNTLDFNLGFTRDQWTLMANLSNALDRRGILSITGTPTGGTFAQYYLQRPRTVNLALRYDY